jgi:hypothetical protein
MKPQKQNNDAKQVPAKDGKNGGNPGWPEEKGGPAGPEPTRYGDWERNGKCVDF